MSILSFIGRSGAIPVVLAALLLSACTSGGDGEDSSDSGSFSPVVINSELVVGENRLMVGLLSQDNQEIIGAEVAFRFVKLNGDEQELRAEAPATPVTIEKTFTHVHEDGTLETHEAGESGVYVAIVSFDAAGQWGVEVTATVAGETLDPAGAGFEVLEESESVAVGAPAPLSDTLTLDDVGDVAEIDTSDPPIPEMHEMTIAEAVTSGRPSLIVFATPAFCLSRICGPTKTAVDDLFEEYRDSVNFVHVEPYELDRARSGEGLFPVPATLEWGLRSEPWVFIVDEEGIVAAKFEAVVTREELVSALAPLVDDSRSG